MSAALLPGFADPVRDSQAVFRAVLDATARPGRIHRVMAPAEPHPPLGRATAALILTLVDAETPLWLDREAAPAREWIAFHCGAPAAAVAGARFAVALGPVALSDFQDGTDEEPETSATLILQVSALGEGQRLLLSGPGLERPAELFVDGLPGAFVPQWAANRARFPRGIDVILCAGDDLAVLPRTARIEAG